MKRYVEREFDANQLTYIPESYDSKIDENSVVRIIDALVESFDMEALGFKYANTKAIGRKPYNPKDFCKLYIYGYHEAIRSSRKLNKEVKRNIELIWLLGGLQPSFKTLADFRKENLEPLMKMFHTFSLLCNELGLYGKELVAVDGSKFRANNSKKKNYTKGKVKKHIEHYEESAKKYIELLDSNDQNEIEDEKGKIRSRKEIQEKIEKIHQKLNDLEVLKQKIEEEGEISMVDPDARNMGMNNRGIEVSHNVQIAVDSKHHLVTAVDVTSSPADQTQLYNMALKAKEQYETMNKNLDSTLESEQEITVLADKGYYSGVELKQCEEAGINTIVSPVKKSQKYELNLNDFYYNEAENHYICPAGNKLICISKESTEKKCYKNKQACTGCPLKEKCTSDPEGKRIFRTPYTQFYENADIRYINNQELYRQRQTIVEHVFGTIKRSLGFSYFLLRGNKKVKTESYMHFFTYNLKRAVNIMGSKALLEALR